MNDFINSVFNNPIIDDATTKATWLMVGVATILSPIFKAIAVGWDMVMSRINNLDGDSSNKKAFHVKELARVMVLAGFIGTLYFPVFYAVTNLANAAVSATTPTSEGATAGKTAFAEIIKKQINGADWDSRAGTNPGQNNTGAHVENELKRYTGFVGPMVVDVLSVVTGVIVGIIRALVQMVCISMSKLFFAIGPLVIAFSILPMFKDKLATWFGVYLNILLVPLMCNLLDFIIYSNIRSMDSGRGALDPISSLAFNLAIIICYCLAFWLTSFIVGASSAGRVLSTGVSAASVYGSKMLTAIGGSKGASGVATGGGGSGGNKGGENSGGIHRQG